MRKEPRHLFRLLLFFSFVATGPVARAEDEKYKGDGTQGGLMPDFPQVWSEDQKRKSICEAVTNTDALWWLDQHGFAGLVAHKDPKDPSKTWRDDAKTLMLNIADRLYGKLYMQGKAGVPEGGATGPRITQYIKEKGFYPNNPNNKPVLTVRDISGFDATHTNWQAWIASDGAVVGAFSWQGGEKRVRHSMAGAGWHEKKEQIIVTHGWNDHPGDKPPYKKPPYGEGETPYIEQYNITLTDRGRIEIPKDKNKDANLFRYDARYISMDSMVAFATQPAAKMQNKRIVPGQKGLSYQYEVENFDFEPIVQVVMEIPVPVELDTVAAPEGWSFIQWDPTGTPDVTPAPTALSEPGQEQDEGYDAWTSLYKGLLWYTTDPNAGILPGQILEGFSFEADDTYPVGELEIVGGVGNNLTTAIDPDSDHLTTEFYPLTGPVPEPATALLFLLALALGAAARR